MTNLCASLAQSVGHISTYETCATKYCAQNARE